MNEKRYGKFTLEFSDGLYIAENGEGVIDFSDPQDRVFAGFVLNALHAAQKPPAQSIDLELFLKDLKEVKDTLDNPEHAEDLLEQMIRETEIIVNRKKGAHHGTNQ